MDLTPEELEEIDDALRSLEELDPAQLPEPVSRLTELLTEILDRSDRS